MEGTEVLKKGVGAVAVTMVLPASLLNVPLVTLTACLLAVPPR